MIWTKQPIKTNIEELSSDVNSLSSKLTKNINVSSLSDLESRILTIGEGMADASSAMGYVMLNFHNQTIPINGGIATVAIARRASGTYIVNIMLADGVLVTDYYYDGAHHWGSMKNEITTLNSKIAKYGYDLNSYKDTNITRIKGYAYKMNNIVWIDGRWEGNATNSQNIVILPKDIRPSNTVYGSGVVYSSAGLESAEYIVNSNGTLRQAQVAGNTTNGSFVFVYSL